MHIVYRKWYASNIYTYGLTVLTTVRIHPVPEPNPTGHWMASYKVQTFPFSSRNLVSYLKQKEAAGVITLSNPQTEQTGVLYAFPPCPFRWGSCFPWYDYFCCWLGVPFDLLVFFKLKQCCGSGSVLDPYSGALWIRSRIPNTDPGPHMYIVIFVNIG